MESQTTDADVRYTVNRMAGLREAEGSKEPTLLFNLRNSYGAFRARKRLAEEEFEEKITALKRAIAQETPSEADDAIAALASQSGLSMDILARLKKRISDGAGSLPTTVDQWLVWTVDWLTEDEDARASLLHDVKRAALGACGAKKDGELTAKELKAVLPGLLAWTQGKPLAEIEKQLGGDPDSRLSGKRVCPRARQLVGSVVPRGFSFIMGLVSHVVEDVDPFHLQEDLSRQLIECLGTAVRKGFDSPEKVLYATNNTGILSRVQAHQRYALG